MTATAKTRKRPTARHIPAEAFARGPFSPLFHHAAELVGKRWTAAILYSLFHGLQRFPSFSPTLADARFSASLGKRCLFLLAPLAMFVGRDSTNMGNALNRFTDLVNATPGISNRMLGERLKELEVEGILERHVCAETPVRIEYLMTAKGLALRAVIMKLNDWAITWADAPAAD